jgi:hypothetical protein
MEQHKLRKRQRNSRGTEKLNFLAAEHTSLLTIELPLGILVSVVLLRASLIHLFLKLARKVDEAANFYFVQLIENEPGIYDKRQSDQSD